MTSLSRINHSLALGRISFLIASAALFLAANSAYARGCVDTEADTTYLPATGLFTVPSGDRSTNFKVSRIVGPGLANEFNTASPKEVLSGNLLDYVANGIVSRKSYVRVSAQMVLQPLFWTFMNASAGTSTPAAAEVKVEFSINDFPIGVTYLFAVLNNDSSFVSSNPFSGCFEVDIKHLRMARKKVQNGGGPCPYLADLVAQLPTGMTEEQALTNEFNCPGINVVAARYTIRYAPPTLLPPGGQILPALPFLTMPTVPSAISNSVSVVAQASKLFHFGRWRLCSWFMACGRGQTRQSPAAVIGSRIIATCRSIPTTTPMRGLRNRSNIGKFPTNQSASPIHRCKPVAAWSCWRFAPHSESMAPAIAIL